MIKITAESENMDVNEIINEAKNIITSPKNTLEEVKDKERSTQDILVYLAVVAVPLLIGVTIGYGVVGIKVGWGMLATHFTLPMGTAVGLGILQYVLSIIGVVIFAYILNALAPSFSSEQNLMQAMKLAAYAATPGLLAGILYILPTLSILVFLISLYGLYILYLGMPVLMNTPEDKRVIYLIVAIVVYIIIMVVVGAVASTVMMHAVTPAIPSF
ncbi:Yip1 family protein [Candidatus Alkanophaga liquidiphilum]